MSIFSEWSPESSYLLGLFYADGHLSKNGHSAEIATKDKQLADLIYHLISNSWIRTSEYPTQKGNRILYRVCFDKLTRVELREMPAIAGKKFDKLRWPPLLPPIYTRDFIRGFFDGDGTVATHSISMAFYSNSFGFLSVIERIGRKLGCFQKELKQDSSSSCYRLNYSDTVETALWGMYMYLYPTTALCLERKRDLLLSHFGIYEIPDTESLN